MHKHVGIIVLADVYNQADEIEETIEKLKEHRNK